ncbi:extracellular solute-binding protein [Corallococcus sp. AB049A]|uniref:Extracellular solute-binding protein n=1 Tax=Corallococcus interemptor TaxID=2316720 RepID=A0A3A8QE72_9BACT|nr:MULTISPECIES: ABC transporter substrate-binding protein [Corallococcus]RKH61534.1 extracellular solute-binding protein [Corallococcus interemptor]RKI51266.1 extracellular solute-binding protein [Corallococcus sp. AB049A]
MRIPLLVRRVGPLLALILLAACRIESAAPSGGAAVAQADTPSGEVWVYTSMYRHVLDAFEPLLKERLPGVKVHWYQAGSEKVASRLEAERAAGAVRADVLMTSDPFLYERLAREGAFLRYASVNALRIPRTLLDLDARYAAVRLSTMVLVHRVGAGDAPKSFTALVDGSWKGRAAIGDPLTSGTAFTWAVFLRARRGEAYFEGLRAKGAVVAGGNAAVLQKVESGEVDAGVLLLENALAAKAKGSPIEIIWPEDGAVVIPGPVGLFASTRNPVAAKALVDVLLSPEGQRIIVEKGDMHAVDPRLSGPRGEPGVDTLLGRAQAWTPELLEQGLLHGGDIKEAFSRAFAK